MKSKYFLVTTAIEQTWSEEMPVLFLGEWCRLYARKDRWSKMDGAILPYHWDDRAKLHSDYLYMNELYEKILRALSTHLNQIHRVDHSVRYWRILVGPWLAYFIHMLMDRWLSIQSAVDCYEIGETIVLTGFEEDFIPNDMNEFTTFFQKDIWNHLIYSEIIKHRNIPFVTKPYRKPTIGCDPEKSSFKNRLFDQYSKLARHFMRNDDVFIRNTYLSRCKEALLHIKAGQFPQFWADIQPVKSGFDWKQRDWRLDIETANEFEFFLLSMIPRQIPKVFLEGYKLLSNQIDHLFWPENPKVIYSSNMLWHDTVSMAYTAAKVDQGSKLVYGQHGGVYGVSKFSFAEEHEIKISDRYLTWGWRCVSNDSIVPVGINKAVKKLKINWNYNDCILLITLNLPRYSYRLCSESVINFVNYIDNSFAFTERLTNELKKKLLIRLTAREEGWSMSARWADRFPAINLDPGLKRMYSLMKKSRIVVSTYNQTGFLETISMRIPVVLFCSLETTPVRESSIPFYAELKRVGIFHETPEAAAGHVNKVWNDVNAWWMSDDVQGVLTKFSNHYCRQPHNIVARINTVFQSLSDN